MLSETLAPEGGELRKVFMAVEIEAMEKVSDRSDKYEAKLAREMLKIAVKRRALLRLGQGRLAAYMARNDVHKELGYPNLKEFFADCGVADSFTYQLEALGEIVVAYGDDHNIPVDDVISSKHFSNLKEAIPALRKASEKDDPDKFKSILHDVRTFNSRDDVRDKYRMRRAPTATGFVFRASDDQHMLVALAEDESAIDTICNRTAHIMKVQHQLDGYKDTIISALGNTLHQVTNGA